MGETQQCFVKCLLFKEAATLHCRQCQTSTFSVQCGQIPTAAQQTSSTPDWVSDSVDSLLQENRVVRRCVSAENVVMDLERLMDSWKIREKYMYQQVTKCSQNAFSVFYFSFLLHFWSVSIAFSIIYYSCIKYRPGMLRNIFLRSFTSSGK